MSEHHVQLDWSYDDKPFTYETYTRNHTWIFDNGLVVAASAAPDFQGNPDRVDPEAAFVASVSSCHMLTFLAIAARKRIAIDQYHDNAVGYLEKNSDGKLAMTRVVLRPKVTFADQPPEADDITRLHDSAHRNCFIANSVNATVTVEAQHM